MTALLQTQRDRNVAAYLVGLLISAGLALIVLLVALDTQSARVLDSDGLSWSLSTLFGPAVFVGQSQQGWAVVAEAGSLADHSRYLSLFNAHIVLDHAFILIYALLGLVVVLFVGRRWWRMLAGAVLVVLVLADLLEDWLATAVIEGAASPLRIFILALLTEIKWLAAAALLIIAVIGLVVVRPREKSNEKKNQVSTTSDDLTPTPLSRVWHAILVQRFSLLPSLIFFVSL